MNKLILKTDRKLMSQAGLTLAELVVASALVGIVMVGTVSVDFAVRSMRKSTSDSAGVAIRTSATMTYITNDVAKATGDATNMGIVDCTQDNSATYPLCSNKFNPTFCVRQDLNVPANPDVYTDDSWVCYWKPLSTTDANIYRCQRSALQGPGECTTGDLVIGTAACSDAPGCSAYDFSFFLTPPGGSQFYFDVNLANRPYPLKPVNISKNPEYELSSRIAPLGHSY